MRKMGAALLFIGAASGIGMLVGWRDARTDQGRLDDAKTEIEPYKKQIVITEDMIADNEAGISEDCITAAMPYILGDQDYVDILEAAMTLHGVEACPVDVMEFLYADRRDYHDLAFNQGRVEDLELDLPGFAEDAARNDELWQGALVASGVLSAIVVVANIDLTRYRR